MTHFSHKDINPKKRVKGSSHSKRSKDKTVHLSLFRRIYRWIPTNKKEYEKKKVPFFLFLITLLISLGIIFKVTYTAYQYIVHFELTDLIGILSTELKKDDNNKTQILLLGTGDKSHDGADLTDTIMIASLNHKTNRISLISMPRDMWIDLPGYGSSRINKIYTNLKEMNGNHQALNILKTSIENITNLDIPYYFKVDFSGFEKVIDTLGGIDITVKKSIYDQRYPTKDGKYEVFSIEAGEQHLNGEKALKYARSRHSTSDFDRAERQQQILNAIKIKAKKTDLLSSPLLLKKLYEDFSENIETNLKMTEIISLARFARNINQNKIISAVLKDIDIVDTGSFLYTPERELYGGAFVLIPVGNTYENIQRFISIVFDFPKFFEEKASIQILNGTGSSGLAAQVGNKLIPYGFNVQHYANADRKDYKATHFYINNAKNTRITEEVLRMFFPKAIKIKEEPPNGVKTDYDISLVIGKDLDMEQW